MFAVTGTWPVDGALQVAELEHIAETVRGQPGFVSGYWGQSPDDATSAHAYVLFGDKQAADAMAAGVAAAIPSAVLQVLEVLVSA